MLYPAYVHIGDAKHAHGITIPDFPGCFSAADDWNDIPRMVQEAFEVHFADGEPVPAATAFETLRGRFPELKGGIWLLVDLDLSKVNQRAVRVNISLPEALVHKVGAGCP